jgi:hypothetical protein
MIVITGILSTNADGNHDSRKIISGRNKILKIKNKAEFDTGMKRLAIRLG